MTVPERKIAYIVSRFPAASETFVVRELNALVADHDVDVILMSLFASGDDFLHTDAGPWLAGLRRSRPAEAATAAGYWLVRRPLRLLGAVARVIAGTWRHPRTLARSIATLPLAAAHARTVRNERISHVHAHFASYPALAAWLCGRLAGVPYSFTAHAYDIFVSQDLLAEKVAGAEFVVTISEFNRRFLRDFGGDRLSPVEVVHAGVDPRQYVFRERTIPSRGPVAALCVATLQEKKGHAVLLEALASVPELERLNVDLVGGGELRVPLEERVAALGLGERVRFLGARDEAEVRARLERADLFVLPSLIAADGQMEGLPVVLIEALACGVPSVSTRLSGIPELISDRDNGVLAEPGDAASLAASLRWVVDGGELDLAAGRRLVEREFDVRKSAARMAELLHARPA
jgi:colanic acid/amylovoran biosynthesis glycosyltransferase